MIVQAVCKRLIGRPELSWLRLLRVLWRLSGVQSEGLNRRGHRGCRVSGWRLGVFGLGGAVLIAPGVPGSRSVGGVSELGGCVDVANPSSAGRTGPFYVGRG